MRLPWWPIYIDARFDEQGVYYTIPDDPEQLSPWHQTRFYVQNKYLVFIPEDESGKHLQHHRANVFFRLRLKDHPDASKRATEFQNAYLEDSQNQYSCKVIWRNEVWDRVFMLVLSIGLPAYGLFMLYQGYQSAPGNEPGVRYQNGLLMSMVALVLITLFIYWRIVRELRRQHQSSRVIEVNQHGVKTCDSDFQWDDFDCIRQHFHHYMVLTKSGEYLHIPNNSCAIWILRNRITHPPVLSSKLFVFCLIGSVLSGPLMSAWFGYLAPDFEQPFGFWGVSLIMASMVLVIYGALYFSTWQSKRQASKSQ